MAWDGRFDELRGALRGFWDIADFVPQEVKDFETRDALMDAANRVFLARDALLHPRLADKDLTILREQVAMVSDLMRAKAIAMSPVAQQKSTGGMTYRPLLVKRFDG